MQVLVTGAAGFIGSHLCGRLLKKKHKVVGVDNLSVGKIENLKPVLGDEDFEFFELDVRGRMRGLVYDADLIVHLAAFKIPRYGNTLDTMLSNSMGTHNLLDKNRLKKVRFILASTSDVYGKRILPIPFEEEDDLILGSPGHRRWAYAVSKLFDEHLLYAYNEAYNIKFNIVRFFNVYGERCALDWTGGAVPQVIQSILKGERVKIHGDGKQMRSYTYIDDTIDGLMGLIEKGKPNQIYNIGSPLPISVNDLVKKIYEIMEIPTEKMKAETVPYKSFFGKYEDVRYRSPDTSKATKDFGFKPRVSLEEGLKKTIKWIRRSVKK